MTTLGGAQNARNAELQRRQLLLTVIVEDVSLPPTGHGCELTSTIETATRTNKVPGRRRIAFTLVAAVRSSRGRRWRLGFGLLAIITAVGGNSAALALSDRVREADDYYLARQTPENLTKGLELLRADVEQDPNDYEAWWRISRIIYYQARHAAASARLKLLDSGNDAGKKAIALEPNRPEGHYWLASNYDLTAEARGYLRGLLWVDAIRKELVTVNRLDPDYEDAGGLRLLGRLDYRAPFFYGGDKRRSIDLLKDCLNRFPDNSSAMLYLSDSYMALGQKDDARKQLEQILDLCENSQRASELAEDQEEARARLSKYFHVAK